MGSRAERKQRADAKRSEYAAKIEAFAKECLTLAREKLAGKEQPEIFQKAIADFQLRFAALMKSAKTESQLVSESVSAVKDEDVKGFLKGQKLLPPVVPQNPKDKRRNQE